MIKVYPNRLAEANPEVYSLENPTTLLKWFYGKGLSPDVDLASLPMTVWDSRGDQVLPADWAVYEVDEKSDLRIYREPKGTDPFSITFALIFGAKAILSALMPKIPGVNNSSSAQGEALDEASTKGNKAKINDVIPELFGFNRRYPDYIVTPRRYFTEPRAQWIEMLLGVGVGKYQIPPSTIKSGETPLLSLGDDAEYAIYPPGADLTNEPAHMYWYSAPEVGAGSTGAAGLELTTDTTLTLSATASAFAYNSTTISIPVGAGSFPSDWEEGLVLNIGDPYAYSVADGTGDDGRDVITGGNTANLGFVPGDTIEIRGDNAGLYVVHSLDSNGLQLDYDGGAPGIGLKIGPVTMAIGFRGLRYRIIDFDAQNLQLERLDSNGQVDDTWPGWISNQSNSGQVQLDASNLSGGYRGPFPACPVGRKVTAFEYSVYFPQGIAYIAEDGRYLTIQVYHQVEWRDMATGGGWNATEFMHSGNSLDAMGYTHRIALPYPMRAEVRMKKRVLATGNNYMDVTQWYSLYGYIPDSSPTAYNDITTIAYRIRGGDRISSQTEALANLECTRILPVLNGVGAWGPEQPTRQISAAIGYIAHNVGYTDDDLDMVELQRLEKIWTARGDYYDKIIADPGTVKDYMLEILQAGFAEFSLDRGQIVPIRDEPRSGFEHIYDPMNMTAPLTRDGTQQQPDDFNGVDVEYFDHVTWASETVQCRLPGDGGTRIEKIKLEGVTDRDRAWRIGMRRRRIQVYRNLTFNFSTELDALNSSYLDYVALGDQVIGYGQSAYITSWVLSGDRYLIGTSENFDWSEGSEFKLSIRRKDGKIAGPYDVYNMGYRKVAILASDYQADPRAFDVIFDDTTEPPFLRFGPADRWVYPALITAVNPSGTSACKAEAVIYDDRVYADDNGFADN